jgi:streptogramin lyase
VTTSRFGSALIWAAVTAGCGSGHALSPLSNETGLASSRIALPEGASSQQFGPFYKDRRPGGYPIGQIVLGPDKNLWFADTSSIGRTTPQRKQTKFAPNAVGNLIANGPANSLWFPSFDSLGNPAISRITTSGSIMNLPIPSSVFVIALAPGADSNEWFADNGRDAIGTITPKGDLTEYEMPDAQTHMPVGISRGPGGEIWFLAVDFYGSTPEIGSVSTSGNIVEYPLPPTCNQVTDSVVLGGDRNLWVSARCGDNAMVRFTASGNSTIYSVRYPMFQITAAFDHQLWGSFDKYITHFNTTTHVQGEAIQAPAIGGHRTRPWALARSGERMWLTVNTADKMAFITSYGAR